MGKRKLWTDEYVRDLKAKKGKRTTYPDPELPAHFARVSPSRGITYCAVAVDPSGKQRWATLGDARVLSLQDARAQAREALSRIRAGQSPKPAPKVAPASFEAVANNWLQRHVVAKGLRSEREIRRILKVYVLPVWGGRNFEDIKRVDVSDLLDAFEDRNRLRQADAVLRILRSLSNWYAGRSDTYTSPFVRGMRRSPVTKRDRTLTDDEIRAVWAAAEKAGAYGKLLRLALLLGQRQAKLASMRWEEMKESVWIPRREDRAKGVPLAIPLPQMAVSIIASQPRVAGNPFVFAARAGTHFNSWSDNKTAVDAMLPEDTPHWTFHDLRRTCRTLLSRAGVSPSISERVIGHKIAGVEGVYDRHSYQPEIGEALKKLETELKGILAKQKQLK